MQQSCHRDVYRSCPEECKQQPVQLLSDTRVNSSVLLLLVCAVGAAVGSGEGSAGRNDGFSILTEEESLDKDLFTKRRDSPSGGRGHARDRRARPPDAGTKKQQMRLAGDLLTSEHKLITSLGFHLILQRRSFGSVSGRPMVGGPVGAPASAGEAGGAAPPQEGWSSAGLRTRKARHGHTGATVAGGDSWDGSGPHRWG